jgi:hypothetical protein
VGSIPTRGTIYYGVKMTTWKNISTAPKDGRQILLCTEERTVNVGWWVESKQRWSYGGGDWGDNVEFWAIIPDTPPKTLKRKT